MNTLGILKLGYDRKASVKHNSETKQSVYFKHSKIFINVDDKQHRKIVESCIIFNYNTYKGLFFVLFFFVFSTYFLIYLN